MDTHKSIITARKKRSNKIKDQTLSEFRPLSKHQPDMDPNHFEEQKLDPDEKYRDPQQGGPPVCVASMHATRQNRCVGFSYQLDIDQNYFFMIIFKKVFLFGQCTVRIFRGECIKFVSGSAGIIACPCSLEGGGVLPLSISFHYR